MSHTPGPWTIRHGCNVFGVRADVGHEGSVATTGGHFSNRVDCTAENCANARLIAASPDLLAACKCALADIEGVFYDGGGCDDDDDPMAQAIRELRAAIAKAEAK